jgi:phage terminase large subunit-like protein
MDPIACGPRPLLRDLTGIPTRDLTRGERVIRFIESHCVVPEGTLVGTPVVLDDFQRLFILAIYDNPAVTDTAILSIARKNAKTATIAFILLAHLVGPEAMLNSRIISGAMSRDQAAEVYNLASKCARLSPKLRPLIRQIPSTKRLVGLPMNVEYQAISAEKTTAHGKSPVLAILDEVGQIRGPQSDFVDAITTAQGAYEKPLLIYISTQSATDADFFSVQIDDARRNQPAKTVCHVYETPPDAPLLSEEGWRASNPALGKFRSLEDMRKQAEKAARMPSFENTFRNLNLNQRVTVFSPFVSRRVWESNSPPPLPMRNVTVYGGLDLSSRTDLTAAVFIAEVGGVIQVWPYFWTPEYGLRERSDRDRQPYDVWVRDGWLLTTPSKTVDYEYVAKQLADILAESDCEVIGFDRWRIDVFKKECDRLDLVLPLQPFGQGYKDMSPALDKVEELLLNNRLAHGMHPVLTMCAANAAVSKDPAGNRKLDKQKVTGRIDGMVALTMAIGAWSKSTDEGAAMMGFLRNPVTA